MQPKRRRLEARRRRGEADTFLRSLPPSRLHCSLEHLERWLRPEGRGIKLSTRPVATTNSESGSGAPVTRAKAVQRHAFSVNRRRARYRPRSSATSRSRRHRPAAAHRQPRTSARPAGALPRHGRPRPARSPAPCLRRPLQSAGLLGLASSSRARRQERGPVFLKAPHGKHGRALRRSCPIDILDGCALVTAQECEHGLLRNGEDELPASWCCSGETGEPSRRIRIKPQLHLDASLSKRLVGHDRTAGVPGQAVETENDCLGLRLASRTLFPDCPEPRGQANPAMAVRPSGVNPEFPGALACATIPSAAGPYQREGRENCSQARGKALGPRPSVTHGPPLQRPPAPPSW